MYHEDTTYISIISSKLDISLLQNPVGQLDLNLKTF